MLDAVDRRMLAVLQAEGRITNQDLAERVGLSPTPCLRRLKRLEESGVITGYAAQVDPKAYGLPFSVFVSVRLLQQMRDQIAEFERAVESWEEVTECYLMTGSQDYLLRVQTDGIEGYERFLKQKVTQLRCIQSVQSNFALATIKRRTALPPVYS
ncbi:Lrp/AsnC family transcriptional regulator [Elstera cyanobacteriorum]|uniref:Lrp/AsnC family transcriptional regulator n=1 Tax=Elstera cyanobacteriorum TaxID=2022747 RepID=UPI00235596E2|nr:Lrp/AsnC family transcriptional regulator [Elstera cyanobacteriorum]MCK6442673.1 Lrp/AsnC family transcriptional regulator [Elstera cyanobacteriorum]